MYSSMDRSGPDVVKRFGIAKAVFPADGAVAGFKRYFRELIDGGAVGSR